MCGSWPAWVDALSCLRLVEGGSCWSCSRGAAFRLQLLLPVWLVGVFCVETFWLDLGLVEGGTPVWRL